MAAVGRGRDAPTDTLFADYARRCAWPIRLVEVQAKDCAEVRRMLDFLNASERGYIR